MIIGLVYIEPDRLKFGIKNLTHTSLGCPNRIFKELVRMDGTTSVGGHLVMNINYVMNITFI